MDQDDFFIAVYQNDLFTVQEIVDLGLDVNEADQDGNHAVDIGLHFGHEDVVGYLIEKGAKVAVVPSSDDLIQAVCNGRVSHARAMVLAGADVASEDSVGTSILELALRQDLFGLAEWLVEHGAMRICIGCLKELLEPSKLSPWHCAACFEEENAEMNARPPAAHAVACPPCSQCGHVPSKVTKFCLECGFKGASSPSSHTTAAAASSPSPVFPACLACGTIPKLAKKFCLECGHKIGATPAPDPAVAEAPTDAPLVEPLQPTPSNDEPTQAPSGASVRPVRHTGQTKKVKDTARAPAPAKQRKVRHRRICAGCRWENKTNEPACAECGHSMVR